MSNPIAVGGISKLVDRIGDEVMQVAAKATKVGAATVVEGKLVQRGNFGFDKKGQLGFVGNVLAKMPEGTTVLDLGGEAEAHSDTDWDSRGTGTLEVEFSVRVTVAPPPP